MKKVVGKRGVAEAKEQPQAGSQKVNSAFADVKKLEEDFHRVMHEHKGLDGSKIPDKAHQYIEQAIGKLTEALGGM